MNVIAIAKRTWNVIGSTIGVSIACVFIVCIYQFVYVYLVHSQSVELERCLHKFPNYVEGFLQENYPHRYPQSVEEIKNWLIHSKAYGNGNFCPFLNPVTGQREWPVLGKRTTLRDILDHPDDQIGPGKFEYTPLSNERWGYAARAGDPVTGRAMRCDGSQIILGSASEPLSKALLP